MRQVFRFCVALLVLFIPTVQAESASIELLERMSQAAKQLNYEGVFAYQSGKTFQSVRIYHRNNDGTESERLISLNGAAREVIRSNDTVTCINPDGKQINVSQRPLGRGFPSDLPRRLRSATPFYELTLEGEDRIAGKLTQRLEIKPVDSYRYGYRLWMDKETDLLLKSELIGENKEVLETFEFTDIETGIEIPDASLKAQMSGNEMVWHRTEPGEMTTQDLVAFSNWQAKWLPDGFTLVAHQNRLRANNGAHIEQRVYSDGLSSVSVFIEKMRAQHNHFHGGSHMGAVNAFGSVIHAHFVTVVGEVPAVTVEKIGAAIEYAGPESR
ncbi:MULTISPECIES: MucB/RseB C-terminal domain-containing protein [unclassified Methylophaga]|jgi:sigma-E factor negative regulatory protein RseB|uniref:MucB/RseB C-terminal domain-containing protein n=1 Tax=unclassified Methylophaga TaxID=2629249 RepID=UPI000C8F9667|nr:MULTISPECIES: MucB/RseB C-terminal domain-containing protein [unclassified Methylophaga]MAK67258.1 transcriptional regulator [Methylophaga sp.]MAY18295.1 transcriptional regulator [Methylophaga sp.]MBN47273.1 transcriptional regulator [Methylophaga sp.]|tara:strand:+ start:541 stop:1521 length:981 start_codon:yes stop_codon:yes gene_type:complete